MSTTIGMKSLAVGCLLSGILAGAVGAQVARSDQLTRFLHTGLFSVEANERADFHVTFADSRGASPATVLVRFLDQNGVAVARREVVLQPGQSTTLQWSQPGLVRADAEVVSSATTARGAVVGSVEIIDAIKLVTRSSCSVDPNGVPGGRDSVPGQ